MFNIKKILSKFGRFLPVALVSLFQLSCEDSPYKGYSPTNTGLYYKIIALGDGKVKPSKGDFLQLSITYKTVDDSLFLDTYTFNETGMVILPYDGVLSFRGSFEEGINKMNEGDVYSFVVSADSLFQKFFKVPVLPVFLKQGDFVKMDITLHHILKSNEYEEELKKYQSLIETKELNENSKLKLFLDTCNTNYFTTDSIIYYLPIKQGVGDVAAAGDEVTVNYKGYFLNGFQFESTYNRAQPLQFILGQEGQVIKGMEKAISLMNEGSKTKFIIPSQLAFGKTGSSTGTVPPFTTVVYEVELLNLIKHNSSNQ